MKQTETRIDKQENDLSPESKFSNQQEMITKFHYKLSMKLQVTDEITSYR